MTATTTMTTIATAGDGTSAAERGGQREARAFFSFGRGRRCLDIALEASSLPRLLRRDVDHSRIRKPVAIKRTKAMVNRSTGYNHSDINRVASLPAGPGTLRAT